MGGVSELRHRRPDEAAVSAPDGPRRQDPLGQDSPRQDREYSERTGIDVRPDRSDGGGYDPDAAFKRPVPKPPVYLPDDTGGRASVWVALRRRGDRIAEPSQRDDPDAI